MRDGDHAPPLTDQFVSFGRAAGRDGSPVYEAICSGAATDPALVELLEAAPLDQRRPNLLLAAVHYLLLKGADDEALGRHYDTVRLWRGGPPDEPDTGQVFADFAAFCGRHRDDLIVLLRSRATQTNEIGRCSALLPALATVAAEHPNHDLGLVDLGASAGLNLLFDRYAYDYGSGRLAGAAGSPVRLDCELRGTVVPPLALAPVAARVGLDRRPVDLSDDEGPLWLLACQWPGHLERFERQRAALAVARRSPGPPPVRAGDMISDLELVSGEIPDEAHLCLFHSWVAAYLSADDQGRLVDAVASLAARRPLSWIFAESPYETPGLPAPTPPGAPIAGATVVVLVEGGRPGLVARRLADMHHHGGWLHWWEPVG